METFIGISAHNLCGYTLFKLGVSVISSDRWWRVSLCWGFGEVGFGGGRV